MTTSAYIISFDNFAEMEDHLQGLLARHKDAAARYREALGEIMRREGKEGVKENEKWLQEMRKALAAAEGSKKKKHEAEKPRGFFKKEKKQSHEIQESWVEFEPFSVFVGSDLKGSAELYFEAINHLAEMANRIQVALNVAGALRSRAASPGGVSLLASFVGGAPSKIIVRPASAAGKKTIKVDLAIPSTG